MLEKHFKSHFQEVNSKIDMIQSDNSILKAVISKQEQTIDLDEISKLRLENQELKKQLATYQLLVRLEYEDVLSKLVAIEEMEKI